MVFPNFGYFQPDPTKSVSIITNYNFLAIEKFNNGLSKSYITVKVTEIKRTRFKQI